MGMSMHVEAIKPPDEKWQKMKSAWDACKRAGVDPPEEVAEFFEDLEPDPAGVLVDLGPYGAKVAREWNGGSGNGFEVDLEDLPKGTKTLRFSCSW